MPSSASVKHPRNQTQESTKAEASHRSGRKIEPPATQLDDRWSRASVHWPEPEEGDPWPELPEDRPVASTKWMEFLRHSERLHALDLEQRGGR
jgi:hypothetical protein